LGNGAGIGHAKVNFMKPCCSERRNQALTLVEVLVVIFVVGFFVLVILSSGDNTRYRKARRIACVNNLKEISVACRIWEGDHGDKYPMNVSVTNGGAMELARAGDAAIIFQVMSNELSTPKILLCPADEDHSLATNFGVGFSAKNISYFANPDASQTNTQSLLSGDDNFEIGGVPVESGLLQISTNTSIAWSAARHGRAGNVAFTDGSVQQLTTSGLQQAFQNAGTATNRIAIP
jgi:prepilin-type processing-associated H-X9-DG protein